MVKASGGGKQGQHSPASLSESVEEPGLPAEESGCSTGTAQGKPLCSIPSSSSRAKARFPAWKLPHRELPATLRREQGWSSSSPHICIHLCTPHPRSLAKSLVSVPGGRRSTAPWGHWYFPAGIGLLRSVLAECLFIGLSSAHCPYGKDPACAPCCNGIVLWKQGPGRNIKPQKMLNPALRTHLPCCCARCRMAHHDDEPSAHTEQRVWCC